MIEDEDVVVTRDMLPEVLETRVGGKSKQTDELELLGDGHHTNSTDAISLGREIWSQLPAESGQTSQPHFNFDEAKVQEAKAASAARSQSSFAVAARSQSSFAA